VFANKKARWVFRAEGGGLKYRITLE